MTDFISDPALTNTLINNITLAYHKVDEDAQKLKHSFKNTSSDLFKYLSDHPPPPPEGTSPFTRIIQFHKEWTNNTEEYRRNLQELKSNITVTSILTYVPESRIPKDLYDLINKQKTCNENTQELQTRWDKVIEELQKAVSLATVVSVILTLNTPTLGYLIFDTLKIESLLLDDLHNTNQTNLNNPTNGSSNESTHSVSETSTKADTNTNGPVVTDRAPQNDSNLTHNGSHKDSNGSNNPISPTTTKLPINWIPINKVLIKLKAIESELRKAIRSHWFPDIDTVFTKIELIGRFIFNDKIIRRWHKNTKVPAALDGVLLESFVNSLNKLVVESSWASNDIVLDPLYLTPEQYNQHSFRNICKKWLPGYSLVEITGDGNCFFRAVIRFFWSSIPVLLEEKVSLDLRKLLNPSNKKRKREQEGDRKEEESKRERHENNIGTTVPEGHVIEQEKRVITLKDGENLDPENLEAFEEEGINDSSTMQKSGVWADHIQVYKLSALLEREVWLYRYDDSAIFISDSGQLTPGENYIIRMYDKRTDSPSNLSPVTLFFIPEVHYELLKRNPTKEEEDEEEARKDLESVLKVLASSLDDVETKTNSISLDIANLLAHILISLLNEVQSLDDTFVLMGQVDISILGDLRDLLHSKIAKITSYLNTLKQSLANLDTNYLDQLRDSVGGKLHASILEEMIQESKFKSSSSETSELDSLYLGPLGSILHKLEYYKRHAYTSTPQPYDDYHNQLLAKSLAHIPTERAITLETTEAISISNTIVVDNGDRNNHQQQNSWQRNVSNLPAPNSEELIHNFEKSSADSLLTRSGITQETWARQLMGVRKYTVKKLDNINSDALKSLFAYAEVHLLILTFEDCEFDATSTKILDQYTYDRTRSKLVFRFRS